MSKLEDLNTQLTRKQDQIDTAQARIDELEAKDTLTDEEQAELDNLRDVIKPKLLNEQSKMNEIKAKFGEEVGKFGTISDMMDTCVITDLLAKEAGSFKDDISPGGTLDSLNNSLNSISNYASVVFDNAWADDINALISYLSDISSVKVDFSDISDKIDGFKSQLTTITNSIKATEWLSEQNPLKTQIIEKLMSCAGTDRTLYDKLNSAVNNVEKSEMIKAEIDKIKL